MAAGLKLALLLGGVVFILIPAAILYLLVLVFLGGFGSAYDLVSLVEVWLFL